MKWQTQTDTQPSTETMGWTTEMSGGPRLCATLCVFVLLLLSHSHKLSFWTHTRLWSVLGTQNFQDYSTVNWSVWPVFLRLSELQSWENKKGFECLFASGCIAFWVLIIQVNRTARGCLTDIKRWNASRWLFKLQLHWDNDHWISTKC